MSNSAAQNFLRSFRKAISLGRPLDPFSDDVDGLSAAILFAPEEMGDAMKKAAADAGGAAIISSSGFASAACDTNGKMLVCDEIFAAWNFSEEDLLGAVRAAGPNAPHLSAILDDVSGSPVAVTVGDLAQARQ